MKIRIRVYRADEMYKLLSNPNVISIENNSRIVYSNEFKYYAVLQKITRPDKTARQIFEEAGFDMKILSPTTPQKRICYWMKQYERFGKDYFLMNEGYSFKAKKKNNNKNLMTMSKEIKELINELKKVIEEFNNDKSDNDLWRWYLLSNKKYV